MCVIIMILVCIYSLHVAESFRNTGEKTNFFAHAPETSLSQKKRTKRRRHIIMMSGARMKNRVYVQALNVNCEEKI